MFYFRLYVIETFPEILNRLNKKNNKIVCVHFYTVEFYVRNRGSSSEHNSRVLSI